MRDRWISLVAVLVLLLAGASDLCAQKAVALLVDVVGEAELHRTGKDGALGACVGMQLFPGDRIRAEKGASLGLFYEGGGLAKVSVPSGEAGWLVTAAPPRAERPGFWSGLASSLSGLLGDRSQVDQSETGAVAAGYILQRPAVKDVASGSSLQGGDLDGASSAGGARAAPATAAADSAPAAPAADEAPAPAAPGAAQAPAPRRAPAGVHPRRRVRIAGPTGDDSLVLWLSDCRVAGVAGTQPPLSTILRMSDGVTRRVIETAPDGTERVPAEGRRLAPGARLRLEVKTASGGWSVDLEVATARSATENRNLAERFTAAGPEGELLLALVLEKRGYRFASLCSRLRYVEIRKSVGRSDRSLAMVWQAIAEGATLVGSWKTAQDATRVLEDLKRSVPEHK